MKNVLGDITDCWMTQDETLRAGVRLFPHSLTAYVFYVFVSYSVLAG